MNPNHSAFFLPFLLAAARLGQGGASTERPASSPAQAAASRAAASRPAPEGMFERAFVVGASVSDGTVGGLSIARMLDRAIRAPHEKVGQMTSGAFFGKPQEIGEVQITRALRRKPTLLLGIDFLFWYSYGYMEGVFRRDGRDGLALRRATTAEEAAIRGQLLEHGLRELERFGGAIVVGDLPDMSGADPLLLNPMQIPTEAVLAVLNERIRAWAAKRGNTLVLPLSRFVSEMKAGRMTVDAAAPTAAPLVLSVEQAMQRDRLHPSAVGIVALSGGICRCLREWLGPSAGVELDATAILREKGLLDSLEEPARGR